MPNLKLITVPYSFTSKLFDAYNNTFKNYLPNDWICFIDADTCFFETSDIGHVLEAYIIKYPDTGLFTCYASRCHYDFQTKKGLNPNNPDVLYWAKATQETRKKLHLQTKPVKRRIAGHLILIKKETWEAVKPALIKKLTKKNKFIKGFDTQLSYAILEAGYNIRLMRGVLLFHYLRFLTGQNTKIK